MPSWRTLWDVGVDCFRGWQMGCLIEFGKVHSSALRKIG